MEKLKRYLVFSFGEYYPGGGMSDVIDSCDHINEIRELYSKPYDPDNGWYGLRDSTQVLDMQERRWLTLKEYEPI